MDEVKKDLIIGILINSGIKPGQLEGAIGSIVDIIDSNYNSYSDLRCEMDDWIDSLRSKGLI